MNRALTAVLFVLAAVAAPAHAEELVRVLAPFDGAELLGGSDVDLAWEPGLDLPAGAGFVEWEAFLSLDGGATYPVRLTPHLDLDVRRVAVRIPQVASHDARLLLRVGDGRREVEVPVPLRLRVRPTLLPASPSHWAPARGEAARPGDSGVVTWVEGSRDGRGWREVEAALPDAGMAAGFGAGAFPWLFLPGPRQEELPVPPPVESVATIPASASAVQAAANAAAPSRSILLLVSRRNE